MPDNGSIQKRDAHEMAHGRPVQITEHTTVTELQPSLSDVVCANKKLQIGFIVALVVLALLSAASAASAAFCSACSILTRYVSSTFCDTHTLAGTSAMPITATTSTRVATRRRTALVLQRP